MRRYETIFIINPDLTEEDRSSLLDRIKEIIPQQEGVLVQEELWGARKLAYEIKKKPRGYYVRMDYCGTGKVVDELERFGRIDERVMKYLTVQLDPEADVEKILEEIAAARAAAQAPAEDQAPQAEEAPAEEKPAETAAEAESTPAEPETATEDTPPEKE